VANQIIRVPIIHDQRRRAWPKHADAWPVDAYLSLADALTRAYRHDAHFTAYSMPHRPYRLSEQAVNLDGGVMMVLFVVDVDCERSHLASGGLGDTPAPDEWWLAELEKLTTLRQTFPGAFIYRTRGGYRIVYRLPTSVILDSAEAVARWRSTYLGWCAALRQRFGIHADPACHDWQRLYRAPHATRTKGGQPEARETLGSPYQIRAWTCQPRVEEEQVARSLAKRATIPRSPRAPRERGAVTAGDGVLFHAFRARGWIDKELAAGKWSVACPWEHQHTKGHRFDTSTILYAPGVGETLGWLHCKHAHCQGRDSRHVLAEFSQAELELAQEAAGIHPSHRSPPRQPRLYAPWFGRRVASVGRGA
jgi:hypothetical protein